MLRRKDLCPGAKECPEAYNEDPQNTERLPCPECPAQLLQDHLATPIGRLIGVAVDLDFALQAGVTVGLDRMTYAEFVLLRQIVEERDKYQAEEIKKSAKRT